MKKYPHGLTLNAVCAAIDDYQRHEDSVPEEGILAAFNTLLGHSDIARALRCMERTADANMAAAQAMRDDMYHWKQRAEVAEAKVKELEQEQAEHDEQIASLQGKFDLALAGLRSKTSRCDKAEAKLADLSKQTPIGRVDRGEVSDNNEYPNARVVCLHDQADWENFQDGTELFLRPATGVGMEKPEPYAWLVHAPQGDYVERNPEVVAHFEGAGLTKCKPLYLDL